MYVRNNKFQTWRDIKALWKDRTTIPLSKGLVAMVDFEDWDRLTNRRWKVDTINGILVVRRNGSEGTIRLDREVMRAHSPEDIVRHINGNLLDFRKENLEVITKKQNCHYRRPYKGRRWKGVSQVRPRIFETHFMGHYIIGKKDIDERTASAYNEAVNLAWKGKGYHNLTSDLVPEIDLNIINLRVQRIFASGLREKNKLKKKIRILVREKMVPIQSDNMKSYWKKIKEKS